MIGWKQDLIHMIGCCWATQEGPLEGEGWRVAIEKFILVMVQKKREWIEVKELTPLKYMPYMAKHFRKVTRKDLQGLGQFTGWIGLGGDYHWRVVQQGLIHQVPHLQDEPIPRMPNSHPSGWPLPARPSSTGTPAMGALAGPPGGVQPNPQGGGSRPASNQGGGQRPTLNQRGSASTPSQSGGPTASSRGGRSSAPTEVPHPPPQEVPLICPLAVRERATAPGPAGISWPCESPKAESLSPRGLPSRSHRHR